ncbi:copper-binding protein [Halostella sp. JP-L12]|uniref:cupredoxin domain-containing protein n=1 Tax=Halostella TaxID=1843185 RepID=UPI000EF7F6EE|nr:MULTISPECIES: plastocyanin/azurin family copper-binding protein [Halostella]NHN46847.1 copper-binding protein [Halostella sp. JP-L12]
MASRRAFLAAAGATVAAGVAGCSRAGDDATVRTTDAFAFDPESPTVASGGTVTWTNESGVGHTVTAYERRIPDGADYFASGGFGSEAAARDDVEGGIVDPGETYETTLDAAGEYEYFCVPHEGSGMTGVVAVD